MRKDEENNTPCLESKSSHKLNETADVKDTRVTIKNQSNSDQRLFMNKAPFLIPPPPQNPLPKGAEDHLTSNSPYPNGEGGHLYYSNRSGSSSCTFFWSKVRDYKTGIYKFNATVTPGDTCAVEAKVGNPYTGDFDVTFVFRNRS